MIFDSLQNSHRYEAMHPLFKKAFDYLKNNDLSQAAPGKIVLDGERLYINVSELHGKKAEDAKLELHRKYIDIQIVFSGNEAMGWCTDSHCQTEIAPYSDEKDIVYFEDTPTTYVHVKPGEFVIFFPEDGHAPCVGEGAIKKAIVKVLI